MASFSGAPLPSQLRVFLVAGALPTARTWSAISGAGNLLLAANQVDKASNIAGLSSTPNSFTDAVYNQTSADTFSLPSTPDGISFEVQTRPGDTGYKRIAELSSGQVQVGVVAYSGDTGETYSASEDQTAWVFQGTIAEPSLNFPTDGVSKTTVNIARQGNISRVDQA